MRRLIFIAAALSMLALTSGLFAQNWNAEPQYGTFTLNTGFTPDPQGVEIMAGGTDDASTLGLADGSTGMPCLGFIAAAQPDVRLHYTSGTTFPLRFYVVSASDTTLAVNLPDTTWRCNDDGTVAGYSGLQPVVHIPTPPTGQYDIWVGTYNPGTPQAAMLYVTELESNHPGIH